MSVGASGPAACDSDPNLNRQLEKMLTDEGMPLVVCSSLSAFCVTVTPTPRSRWAAHPPPVPPSQSASGPQAVGVTGSESQAGGPAGRGPAGRSGRRRNGASDSDPDDQDIPLAFSGFSKAFNDHDQVK